MKICCLSDLHGHLPEIEPCDLLLISGDICPDLHTYALKGWLETTFLSWAKQAPCHRLICTWGNHDSVGVDARGLVDGKVEFLCDSMTKYEGLSFWGSPWTPRYGEWSFQNTSEGLDEIHRAMPHCDVLLSHGPPYGILDRTRGESVGSPSLLNWVNIHQPRLLVCGHIHECGGRAETFKDTLIINAAHCDINNTPRHRPFYTTL